MGRERRIFGVILIALSCTTACGARQNDQRRVMPSERLLACDTLLAELRTAPLSTASEPELESWMAAAERSKVRCAELWAESAESDWEQQIALHRSYQLPLQSLLIETAMSQRFDDHFGFCEIVQETFGLLFEGLTALESALANRSLSDETRGRVTELRDLDLEALDVLMMGQMERCGDNK